MRLAVHGTWTPFGPWAPATPLLSSDLGQPATETVAAGLTAFHRGVVARGIPENHAAEMMIANPHRLLLAA